MIDTQNFEIPLKYCVNMESRLRKVITEVLKTPGDWISCTEEESGWCNTKRNWAGFQSEAEGLRYLSNFGSVSTRTHKERDRISPGILLWRLFRVRTRYSMERRNEVIKEG
jgi:hypothetical protein